MAAVLGVSAAEGGVDAWADPGEVDDLDALEDDFDAAGFSPSHHPYSWRAM